MSKREKLSKLFHRHDNDESKSPQTTPPRNVTSRSTNQSDLHGESSRQSTSNGARAAAQRAAVVNDGGNNNVGNGSKSARVNPEILADDLGRLNTMDAGANAHGTDAFERNTPASRFPERKSSLKARSQAPAVGVESRKSVDRKTEPPLPSNAATIRNVPSDAPPPVPRHTQPVAQLQQDKPVTAGKEHTRVSRKSLDKPLPSAPRLQQQQKGAMLADQASRHDSGVESALGREKGYLVKDAKTAPDLSGIVDLRNTEDTTVHETWAPAVTHETITRSVHHIREERITREIHNHEVYHRILPIIDIEVLPARHFVPMQGGYAEISASEVPGRTGRNTDWAVAEFASKMLPGNNGTHIGPRQFTARKFEGTDGDYKESIAPEGHPRTEQTWVHPPTIEDGAQATGQTYPFHFNSSDPAQDGLRANLPAGRVLGVSPMLAKEHKEGLKNVPYEPTEDTPSLPQPELPTPSLDMRYDMPGRMTMNSEAFL